MRETGPAHMKSFVTRCTVNDIVTEGTGHSKKASKKKAAELMLEKLKELPPLPAVTLVRPKTKMQMNKKKNRNIIKVLSIQCYFDIFFYILCHQMSIAVGESPPL